MLLEIYREAEEGRLILRWQSPPGFQAPLDNLFLKLIKHLIADTAAPHRR
jgi:hypothetical protein